MGLSSGRRLVYFDEAEYYEVRYSNEKQLEGLAVQNRGILYGSNTLYVDVKKKITSEAKNSRIPDGFLLTGTNQNDAMLWFVEYELAAHDPRNHIQTQLMGFMRSVQNEKSKKIIRNAILDVVRMNPDFYKRVESMMGPEKEMILFLEKVIENNIGIVVVIDKKSEQLQEVIEGIEGYYGIESQVLEFVTFEDKNGQKIFLLDKLIGLQEKIADVDGRLESIHSRADSGVDDAKIPATNAALEGSILGLDQVEKRIRNSYTGFWCNNRLFLTIRQRKSFLLLQLTIDIAELDDPRNIARAYKDRFRGSVFEVRNQDELEYSMTLIRQSYEKCRINNLTS